MVMLLTMLGTGVVNVSLDRLAYKPLRRAPRIAALITAVGASFALENIMQNWYGPSQILYPNVFPDINLAQTGARAEHEHFVVHQGSLSVWGHHAYAGCPHVVCALHAARQSHSGRGARP